MRPNFVLIDFENVQPAALAALEKEHFHVMVFVGAAQTRIPIELAKAIQRMGSRAQYVQISSQGTNALDFHIAFYIGHLAEKHPEAFFHIISKDKGFDPLIDHLKSRGISCLRSLKIEDIPILKNASLTTPEARADIVVELLRRLGAALPRVERTLLSSINTHFQKLLSADDQQAVIAVLRARGHIETSVNGRVTYKLSQ